MNRFSIETTAITKNKVVLFSGIYSDNCSSDSSGLDGESFVRRQGCNHPLFAVCTEWYGSLCHALYYLSG